MKNKKELEFFIFNYDDKDLNLIEDSEKALTENLSRIMQFFNLSALSDKITVDFYPSLEQWISFIESKGQPYQDFIVGLAEQNTISVLVFDQYEKTNMHKNSSFERFLQVIVHECVHICNFERIENPNNSVSFIMEGLATYLSKQDFNPNIKADYDCATMCNYQSFFSVQDPYSVAQILVRKMLEKLSANQVVEYSGNLEKLWNDWEKIF